MAEMTTIDRARYSRDALFSQSACNAGGVLRSAIRIARAYGSAPLGEALDAALAVAVTWSAEHDTSSQNGNTALAHRVEHADTLADDCLPVRFMLHQVAFLTGTPGGGLERYRLGSVGGMDAYAADSSALRKEAGE